MVLAHIGVTPMPKRRLTLVLAIGGVLILGSPVAATGLGGWDPVGLGATSAVPSLGQPVYALNADKPGVLLAGGLFVDAGGHAVADHIASWNGAAWSALGSGLNGSVYAIEFADGKVYAGGDFTDAGGHLDADFLAGWNGTSWGPFCNSAGPGFDGTVKALQVIDNTLYVGG